RSSAWCRLASNQWPTDTLTSRISACSSRLPGRSGKCSKRKYSVFSIQYSVFRARGAPGQAESLPPLLARNERGEGRGEGFQYFLNVSWHLEVNKPEATRMGFLQAD